MKARLVQMGNSRGVRIPKPLIEEAGLEDEVDLRIRDGAIVISAAKAPRADWAEAAAQITEGLLDAGTSTRFDEDEWQW